MTSLFNSNIGATRPKQIGEVGQIEYAQSERVGDFEEKLCQLFFQLTRTSNSIRLEGISTQYKNVVESLLLNFYAEGVTPNLKQEYKHHLLMFYTLILQTRDIKHGKGECTLTYRLVCSLLQLAQQYPQSFELAVGCVYGMTGFIEDRNGKITWNSYGSWKDIKYLLKEVDNDPNISSDIYDDFELRLLDIMCCQLRHDANSDQPSLCAKWVPREKSAFGHLFRKLAIHYFHHIIATANNNSSLIKAKLKSYKLFRSLISDINRKIDTPQIKQCSSRWSEINFSTGVTSNTLQLNWRAFMNKRIDLTSRSNSIDRLQCANNLQQHIRDRESQSKKTTIQIGNLIKEYAKLASIDCGKDNIGFGQSLEVLDMQWKDIVNSVPDLGEIIPLVDLSQSVSSDIHNAHYTAIGMGLLIAYKSKITNRMLVFSKNAEWINCPEDMRIYDTVRKIMSADHGTNSKLSSAINMITMVCQSQMMEDTQIKKLGLMVISDMQNDHVYQNCFSLHDSISASFQQAGIQIKKTWSCPRLIYWNVRNSTGFPCFSKDNNVTMLSGVNHKLLASLRSGNNGIENEYVTPSNSVRHILESIRYNPCKEYFDTVIY